MVKNNIQISRMTVDDLEKIKNNLESFDDFWNYNTLKDELKSEYSYYIVAKKEKSIIGFAGIKIIFKEAELMNIVVRSDLRHKGIGSLLLENIISICGDNKIERLNLEVNIKNTLAINLYNKYNFSRVGLRKKYYNGTDDAILMTYIFSYT